MLQLLLVLALTAEPPYPAGIEIHESKCASGAHDWFFFPDQTVIAAWCCDIVPFVYLGTWRREGPDVIAEIRTEWRAQGRGRKLDLGCNEERWEDWVAARRNARGSAALEQRTFKPDEFSATGLDSCSFARRHDRAPDPHAFLRQFDGAHPETFRRVLDAAELKEWPAEELRAMRNEIFARYGRRFEDPALAARFSKFKGYSPLYSNVDAFLSDTEQENVKRLAAAEQTARSAGTGSGR